MIKFDLDRQTYLSDAVDEATRLDEYAKFVDIINTFISDNLTSIAIVVDTENGTNSWCKRSPINSHVGTIYIRANETVDYVFRWTAFKKHALDKGIMLDKGNFVVEGYNLSDNVEGSYLFSEECWAFLNKEIEVYD